MSRKREEKLEMLRKKVNEFQETLISEGMNPLEAKEKCRTILMDLVSSSLRKLANTNNQKNPNEIATIFSKSCEESIKKFHD